MKKILKSILILVMCIAVTGCTAENTATSVAPSYDGVPSYSGEAYTVVNGNNPYFTEDEITSSSFEEYGRLDSLGRCTYALSCIGKDIMPVEERGSIGQVKPTGWQTVKYDNVDGKYLYNRCHLIGYQLTGENANERNLITGTRYMNVEGMLPFEDMVADYVKETYNHVMYRVTPYFEGNDLVAKGCYMEAYSVEDRGDGITFNVFVHNIQPGIEIDYSTGESRRIEEEKQPEQGSAYIVNVNTGKFHRESCGSVADMSPENRKVIKGKKSSLMEKGYEPCKRCNP